MRILVTGGAGFIGSWTVEALIAEGHDVAVYDSFVTGRLDYLPQAAVTVMRGDVRHPLATQRAVRRFKPEAIIHLAACVSVPISLHRPIRSHDDNVRGTLVVLEAARVQGVRRVVLASSAAVYGRNTTVPLAETALPDPLSPYALHKRVDEQYAQLYAELYGLHAVALRYFNVYGPRQDPASPYSGVIARFVDAARQGLPLTITGDGSQTRDFVYVGDVARANAAAVTADTSGYQVANVATGHEVSLLELRSAIEELTRRPLPYTLMPPRPGDVGRSWADVRKLRALFGVTCSTNLLTGLAQLPH